MITAPPVASAVKRYMNIVLKEFTRDTPDTADSPAKLTINVSAIPTIITSSCSKNNGSKSFFKSLLVNKIIHLLVVYEFLIALLEGDFLILDLLSHFSFR